jgi:hypothetical protein
MTKAVHSEVEEFGLSITTMTRNMIVLNLSIIGTKVSVQMARLV